MAKLLLDWLNQEVLLSKEVVSLEDDFVNGYLLGEILFKFNQLSDLHHFSNKNAPESKIQNFCLLEPILRQLGVYFNAKVAFEIMNRKKGVMKTMLYEIRTVLESVKKRSSFIPGKNSSVLRVIQPSKPSFEKTKADTFQTALRGLIENPNEVMMERHLQRFQDKKSDFIHSVSAGHLSVISIIESEVQKTKQLTNEKKVHEKQFADTWDLINTKIWKENQRRARNRNDLIRKVQNDFIHKKEKYFMSTRENERNSTLNEIDDFDTRIKTEVFREDYKFGASGVTLAIKTIKGEPKKGIPTISYLDQQVLHTAMTETQKTMTEHHEDLLIRQQVHGRRQRRFVRERESYHTDILHRHAQADISNQLLIPSSSEQLETQMKNSILLHKQIILENRKYRDYLEDSREGIDEGLLSDWHEEEAKREYHWVIKPRLYAQRELLDVYEEAQSSASRRFSLDLVEELVDRLVDLTMWVVSCRDTGLLRIVHTPAPSLHNVLSMDTTTVAVAPSVTPSVTATIELLPERIWKDALRAFTYPDQMPTPWPSLIAMNVHNEFPYSLSERPSCANVDWLYSGIFDGGFAFAITNDSETVRGDDDDVAAAPDSSSIAKYLAGLDREQFIEFIASPGIDLSAISLPPVTATTEKGNSKGGNTEKSKGGTAVSDDSRPGTAAAGSRVVLPPAWISTTPSEYLLGEALIRLRCASEPLPEDPKPEMKLPDFPLRIALWGISDKMRKIVAGNLAEAHNVAIIKTTDLVTAAFSKGESLQQQVEDGDVSLDSLSRYEQLALEVYNTLAEGLNIETDLYIYLIREAIMNLKSTSTSPENGVEDDLTVSPGFVIEDFPNTFQDAKRFVEVISGIDFTTIRPNPLDRQSKFALAHPQVTLDYDVLKCGLDALIYLESEPDVLILNRLGERKDLLTGETMYIDENINTPSIEHYKYIVKPTKPIETYALGLNMSMNQSTEISKFFNKLQIFKSFNLQNYETMEEFSKNILEDVELIKNSKLTQNIEIISMEEDDVDKSFDSIDNQAQGDLSMSPGPLVATPAAPQSNNSNSLFHEIPKILADALVELWNTGERQSSLAIQTFFSSLRSIRFQLLQRRRCLSDTISMNLVLHDDRQSIYEDFRFKFNELENDFRYDSDCIAELHLRTQELRDQLWVLAETRKKESENILRKFANDGTCGLLAYHCQSQGVALLQSEINRYNASLNILFDLFYSSVKRSAKDVIFSPLEESVPFPGQDPPSSPQPGGTGKGTGKAKETPKDKKPVKATPKNKADNADVAVRGPLAPQLITTELSELPEPELKYEEDEEGGGDAKGTKAKNKSKPGTAKGKKGVEEIHVGTDPLVAPMKAALDLADSWAKGNYTVNRALYSGDEAMSSALENAVWYETERFKRTTSEIQQVVSSQVNWLTQKEAEFIAHLKGLIHERMHKELSVTERLISMIQSAIEDNSPIREEWLFAADSLVIKEQDLVYPPQPPLPIPEVTEFYENRLNEEQLAVAQEMLRQMQVGRVVLDQDLNLWMRRTQNHIGPLSCCSIDEGKYIGLTWPRGWNEENFLSKFNEETGVKGIPGTDETSGGVSTDLIIGILQTLQYSIMP